MDEALSALDATALAELVRRTEIQPIELVDAAIDRIERLNRTLNAVVTPTFELARETARGPLLEGPFRGVPFLLKDVLAEHAGVRLTEGSRFLADFVSSHDQELVARHKRAGLVILGKTNAPEFGILPTTEPALFGPCRNPWDTGRSTGGSSGGSAAAVASGMVPMAHASDGGGSIRIPASCCGLFGLKPTRARNPLGPAFGDMAGGAVAEHAVTRTVRDSAALLDATAGPDVGDPYWAPPPARPFLEEVGAPPGRLRVGVSTTPANGVPVDPACLRAVEETGRLCARLGHEVAELDMSGLDGDAIGAAFLDAYTTAQAWAMQSWSQRTGRPLRPDEFEPLTWAMYEMAQGRTAGDYLCTVETLQRVARQFCGYFVDVDVLLTPTLAEPPLPLGSFDGPPDNPLFGLLRAGAFVPFTPIANITGQPAMSVPLTWSDGGLPIGSHFIGRFGDEATLFRLAAQLEEARPWAARRPRVWADGPAPL
jgi:amidase